ncbi:MAG: hypothetical protein IT365_01910 [Candidatus Hydrogenedentes bacterium]|nr:hypothetical protein [Candidatus Hydrogenedentota bacterium]
MPSDYERITSDNIRRRGEDFADIGHFLAERLYGDRSHFIYELLQNAEDALARRRQEEPQGDFRGDIEFRLHTDRLEVSHFGKLFDEEDVRAICDVLHGTKNERLDQIGTFGIGFKSVYAFTSSPEIHSGDEHFVIEQFIRPSAIAPRVLIDKSQTLFYFPFNHPEFGADVAFSLIRGKLLSLGPRSLLFLHHIQCLQWLIAGVGEGCYLRDSHPSNNGGFIVQIIGEGSGQESTEEDWLVMQKEVLHPTRPEKLPVKIAYSLKSTGEGRSVQPLPRSPLTAYFPTARETGLAFLIHGPFASTPARDNIESDSTWNDRLLSEIASLVAESLRVCKKHGFLTASFLSVLPIDNETFPTGSTFRPIYDAVLAALTEGPLIPTADGGHASATAVVLGRSQEMRDLLPQGILQELLGIDSGKYAWVDGGVTENRLPKVWQYLRDECGISVIDGETFARHLSSNFLDARTKEWMVRFYSFLTGQEALWRAKGTYNYPLEGPLRKKAIIRCDDGVHRTPFDDFGRPSVFLPVTSDMDCHMVNREIYRDEKAAGFFQRLGLVVPDICTRVINNILPLYTDDTVIEDDDHNRHLATICEAMHLKDSPRYTEMVHALRRTTWVLARNADSGEEFYTEPTKLFFPSSNLQLFFDGNTEAWFLAEECEDIDWQTLGVRNQPVVNCRGLNAKNLGYVTLYSSHGWHKRGFEGFDPNTSIDGLKHALENITLEKAAFIWNELLPPLVRFLHGRYQTATHQNYDNATTLEEDSDLCKMLKSYSWIPIGEDDYKRPNECTVADMAGELRRNSTLIRVLGIQPDPQEVAQGKAEDQESLIAQAGFPPEIAALLVRNREAFTVESIADFIATHAQTAASAPEFPERRVPNPERRATGVRNRTRRADPKTYDEQKRSVRTSRPQVSPKVWLREMYTNEQNVMVCQICCRAMPFKIPTTGEYYFEAVQVADNFSKEDHSLYLALCPLCAAKYSVLVKGNEKLLSDFIWAVEQADTDSLAIPAQIGETSSQVRFVESHLHDLRIALDECLSTGGADDSCNVC